MKPGYLKDIEFYWVQRWVRLDTEGSDAHVLEDIEDKEDEREVTF